MTTLQEQTLIKLIPRHSGNFPPELLELSRSLLAQSKNKASNLKAEEEIARLYACANLACERLKTTLNLPPIEPRPPIPPRQYKKLYTYFDSILTTSTTPKKRKSAPTSTSTSTPRPRRPTSTSKSTTEPTSTTKPLPQTFTPSRTQSLASFRSTRAPKTGLKYNTPAQNAAKIPRWVTPAIRALCRAMDSGRATGHVVAGVESVLCLPSPRELDGSEKGGGMDRGGNREKTREKKMEGKLPALLAAIWFFVARKLSGREMDGKEYIRQRRRVLEVLNGVKKDEVVRGKAGGEEEAWREWEVVSEGDVNGWLTEISEGGWLEGEWLRDVQEGRGLRLDENGEEEDGERKEGEEEFRENARELVSGGLGTMRQDRYDYLSEAKREEYEEWKASILARCDELEAEEALGDRIDTA